MLSRHKLSWISAASLIGALALLAAAPTTLAQDPKSLRAQKKSLDAPAQMELLGSAGSIAPMLARVIPAVVTVLVTGAAIEPVEWLPRQQDGKLPPSPAVTRRPFRSGATGVIIDRARGHILTNNHVIEDAVKIEVSLSDGRRMPARLVGRDPATDLAVLEVDDRTLPQVTVGNSDRLRVGDLVAAIGNPYGLEGTATLGIVSALMRTEGAFEDFIQIDAAIHPGNSGGALVNAKGELVGINTAGAAAGKGAGIGFAIPVNMARQIKNELIARGHVKRGMPGLVVEDLTFELMGTLKTPVTRGALITTVIAGSPAAAAGVPPGGIVVSVADKPVRSASEFNTRFGSVPVGTTLQTVININGKDTTFQLTTAELIMPSNRQEAPRQLGGLAGAVVEDIALGNPLFGQLRGAHVHEVKPGTAAYVAGIAKGDTIVAVDNQPVRGSDELLQAAERTGMQYRVRLIRDGVPGWLRITR
jgi:S1-C subfamily serine protease